MDRDKIIQMAREAGLEDSVWSEEILRFAAAIRAATKEEDARICEEMANREDASFQQEFALDLAADAIRASE